MKIVVNRCFGGFSVSEEVYNLLGFRWDGYGFLSNGNFKIKSNNSMAYRADEKLIEAIELIGEENSSGSFAKLEIVDIPEDVEWEIGDYDGQESIHEVHRSW